MIQKKQAANANQTPSYPHTRFQAIKTTTNLVMAYWWSRYRRHRRRLKTAVARRSLTAATNVCLRGLLPMLPVFPTGGIVIVWRVFYAFGIFCFWVGNVCCIWFRTFLFYLEIYFAFGILFIYTRVVNTQQIVYTFWMKVGNTGLMSYLAETYEAKSV